MYELVNAILLYGDPRHMPNQSFNQGNVSALAAPGVRYYLSTLLLCDLLDVAQRLTLLYAEIPSL